MKAVAKFFTVALSAIVVLVSNPIASHANGGRTESKKASLTDEQVLIKYIGTENGQVVFHVEFENPTGEKFALIIRNDNGDVVFHQQFSGAHFSRNVLIDNAGSDMQPTFVIRTAGNNEFVRQFRVAKTVTENTTVTRL